MSQVAVLFSVCGYEGAGFLFLRWWASPGLAYEEMLLL